MLNGHEDVRKAVDALYEECRDHLKPMEQNEVFEAILREKNTTISELRFALSAQTKLFETQREWVARIKRSRPVRVMRRLGLIDLVKRRIRQDD